MHQNHTTVSGDHGGATAEEAESFLFAHSTVPLVAQGWGDGTGNPNPKPSTINPEP